MPLDPNNPVPLHIQLKEEIERQIVEKRYQEKIPSERELMETYSVSRSTVREAVNHLVREGVLIKQHGRGTFISLKPIQDWLGNLCSTSETIRNMGMEPGAKLLEHKLVTPPDLISRATGFKQAYFMRRLRYANHIPIGIESHYYPVEIGERLVQFDLHNATLYDLMEKELHIRLGESEQTITSGIITSKDAALLQVKENANVLKVVRILSDSTGDIIEYEEACYRADMYSFRIKSSRKYK
ncbi:GntR family transcriptional regulator [Brevibacillus sp. SIMBA_040]|uniref:GntR family transcriptional regulator n=1 Tax=unclassified Brevibacillus TaxID=2684853 RepID=UPI00397B50A7